MVSQNPVLKLASITTICSLCRTKNVPLSDPKLLSLLINELKSTVRNPQITLLIIKWVTDVVVERLMSLHEPGVNSVGTFGQPGKYLQDLVISINRLTGTRGSRAQISNTPPTLVVCYAESYQ